MFCAIFKLNQSSLCAGPPRAIWIHRNKCTSRSDTRIKELKWAEISATTSMGGIPLNCLPNNDPKCLGGGEDPLI